MLEDGDALEMVNVGPFGGSEQFKDLRLEGLKNRQTRIGATE